MAEHEHNKENRSDAMSPEILGAINMATSAAVKEAVTAMMAGMAPLIKQITDASAFSPEKLGAAMREANKDPEEEARKAKEIERKLREMTLWKEDEAENRRLLAERQDNCLHQDDNGRSSIQLVHNFPDHHARGLCVKCQALIYPREWRIGAPTPENPRGVPFLFGPHKNYQTVVQLQNRG